MKNKVLVLTRVKKSFQKKLLKLNLKNLEIIIPKNEDEIRENIGKANIILGAPPIIKDYLNEAKNLAWVQSTFAGVDSLISKELKQDYVLTNVKDTYGEMMAEYTIGYILLFKKKILQNIQNQQNKIWQEEPDDTLKNEAIGIVGTGSIGKVIAKRSKTFGLKTYGFRSKNEPVKHFDKIFTKENLKDFLSQSDYIVSVLPRTKDTDDFFDKKTFSMMKKSAVFINIGRGNAVVENDLVEALNKKIISKAVVDVFKEEPLPKNSILWKTPNLFITPHISGYTISNMIFKIFEENYNRFISNKELLYKIDFNKGY
jgi:phosphoglycerate dehydrogenase-like enzyme